MLLPLKWPPCRRAALGRVKTTVLITSLLLTLLCCVIIVPVRNVAFSYFLKYAWREVSTYDLVRIHYSREIIPDGLYANVKCGDLRSPKISRIDIDTSMFATYPVLDNSTLRLEVLHKRHGRFLPALNTTQKTNLFVLYSVLREALESVKVEYFLVGGSLMGLVRNGGMIPWDDDLDVSVHFNQWQLVKQTLSCVRGYTLTLLPRFHWKFRYMGADFPFIDIFFYKMDEIYVWSVTDYIRSTYIYPTQYVFPLVPGNLEGLKVLIPNDALAISKRVYTYDVCVAYPSHDEHLEQPLLKEYPHGFDVEAVDCQQLSYIYTTFGRRNSTPELQT